jgi:predicted nuclease of predicted toxin-antitoxin system
MYEITPDTEIYRAANGTEVIVSNDLDFYINNLNYDSVKLSPNLRNHQSKIKDIIKTLSNSSNKIAKNFVKDVTAYGDKPSLIMD